MPFNDISFDIVADGRLVRASLKMDYCFVLNKRTANAIELRHSGPKCFQLMGATVTDNLSSVRYIRLSH